MSTFIQIHMLTSYPPANVNRDDLGRPKTAKLGGANRFRISSQCLKRTWRTSDVFQEAVADNRGFRTKQFGNAIVESLEDGTDLWQVIDAEESEQIREPVPEEKAEKWAKDIVEKFGDIDEGVKHSQLVFITPEEIEDVNNLLNVLVKEDRAPEEEELNLLRSTTRAVDVAMFGRMMASSHEHSIEGAVQVAHAISTNKADVENDYFSAVEDLNQFREDAGAAHIDSREFGAGLFYIYACVNKTLLLETLSEQGAGKEELATRSIKALIDAMATETPSGMKNSFGSSTYASYILVEAGENQPRNFSSLAYINPVRGNILEQSIKALKTARENVEKMYGDGTDFVEANVLTGEGNMDDFKDFLDDN